MTALGLFGGTFDPVHNGHIEMAVHALEFCELDEVIFIPAASPPHKSTRQLTPFLHRVAMLSLAIAGDRRFSISQIEKHIPAPSYTVDMLSALFKERQHSADYYFLIGLDAFLDIYSWKEYEKVISTVHVIIFARPGYSGDDLHRCLASLNYAKSGDHWYNEVSSRKVYYIDREISGISSTEIRRKIGRTKLPDSAVAPAVYRYIKDHNLYTS